MNYESFKELSKYILADYKLSQIILTMLAGKSSAKEIIKKVIEETDKEVEDLANGKKDN